MEQGYVVVAENLVKDYSGKIAVRGVSLRVKRGEIYGLIGPNGAGKTTTLRMLSTLVKPTSGRIYIDGVDALADPVRARRSIGYLPEDADVYARLTGLEHLRLYAMLRGEGDVEEKIKYGAELSGLGEKLREKAGGYSKGMKRRLLLAAVLMNRPRLAILDEPTSGLDVYASVRVRRMIKSYVSETGAAVILSSHNMLEVEYLCDRIAFINKGRIIAEGAPEELKHRYGAENLEEAFVAAVEEGAR